MEEEEENDDELIFFGQLWAAEILISKLVNTLFCFRTRKR